MHCKDIFCEIITTDLSHYRTQLHSLNAKRKLVGYPPLSVEEFDSDSKTDDLSLNLDFNNIPIATQIPIELSIPPRTKKCVFCNENETATHYRDHGFSDEQAYYLKNTQCYICYEKFFNTDILIRHIDSGNHRTAVTDGTSLYLENGKILNPGRTHMPVKLTVKPSIPFKAPKRIEKMAEKRKELKESEQLIVSITNNRTWGKFLH